MRFKTYIQTSILLTSFMLAFGCKQVPLTYPQRKDLIETVYASGKLVSENEYSLSALCTGRIIKKLVKDGDTVKKGQLLYLASDEGVRERADAALISYNIEEGNLSDQSPLLNDLKLSLQNAILRFRNDSLTYYRWNSLWAENIGTKNNLDNAYSNYQISLNQKKIAEQKYLSALNDIRIARGTARSQLSTARKDLKDFSIRSDRDGIVYQTFREIGESVRTHDVVALLGDSSPPLLRLSVDQQDVDKLRAGQTVLVQADVSGSKIYEAVVTCIYPVMNETDQTFRVDARFTRGAIPPFIHSSVEANIIVQKKNKVLVLPRTALIGKDSVLVYHKGKENKLRVQTGISTLDYIEIVSGITEKTAIRVMTKK
ncbi:MAG TPA: HlyD family efflux transporter periplasmic adaptor subunit [Puia sp.]|nr:HlyD family efflux transporter periplasmic adaptor subunit [Puia sp.]